MKFLGQGFEKLEPNRTDTHTDTQTDVSKRITTPPGFHIMVQMKSLSRVSTYGIFDTNVCHLQQNANDDEKEVIRHHPR